MTKLPKLTPKQEAFARAYIENGGNAREAYEAAGYSQNMSKETQKVNACRLLQSTNVALTVDMLRKEHAKRHNVTIDTITEMLREDRKLARDIEQPGAAVSASMGIAKIHGFGNDRVLKGDPDHPLVVHQVQMVVIDTDDDHDDEREMAH